MPGTRVDHPREDLRQFARDHHVCYEVAEDPPAKKEAARSFEVRLFATHGDEPLEAPLCPRCVEVSRALKSFASAVVASVDAGGWAEIRESSPVLYASTDPRGPDEVSLSLHVLGGRRDERAAASDEHLHAVEEALKRLGIGRR